MKIIHRKSLIYKSGVAEDFYCLNHVLGCSHGCRYPCYAFLMAKSHGRVKSEAEWCEPKMVGNALELLDKELPRLRGKIKQVHLCLTTDPFMRDYPEASALSLAIIEKINRSQIPVTVLTKGILPRALGDAGIYLKKNVYGISLVSLSEAFRREWEPNTASYAQRIEALQRLHEQGFLTRVHMEPYPTPQIMIQDLNEILDQVAFVDKLYFGGWNYNARARAGSGREAFYREMTGVVEAFCRHHEIELETA